MEHILYGFSVALQPTNLLFVFIGCVIGSLIGVLPGLGPVATISILLPVTYYLNPVTSIIMLAGIFYGAQYGGSTTSILVNIPGEATSVATCIDGYQMTLQGRAGPALGIAAFGSFIAGTVATIVLMLVGPPIAEFGLKFGPPEIFSLMVMGMTFLIFLTSKSFVKAVMVAMVGVILASIGTDTISGKLRYNFGILQLMDGLGTVPVVMGLFGISEIFINVEQTMKTMRPITEKITGLLPSRKDWKDSALPIARGTVLGFLFGVIPGAGSIVSTFISYATEKRLSKHPERFGKGAIEGVAGPESANNAGTSGAFVPLLSLGLPSNAVMAVFMGALMIHGVQPGPMLIVNNPDMFWGVITSMYAGNIMLLILNLPLIPLWVKVLKVPYRLLFPLILLYCMVGAYSIDYMIFDMIVMCAFGVLGYLMKKFEYEMAPLILAFVLSPMIENALQQSLILSNRSFMIFLARPISATCLGIAFLLVLSAILPWIRKRRARIASAADEE